jgi:hypothetical protein
LEALAITLSLQKPDWERIGFEQLSYARVQFHARACYWFSAQGKPMNLPFNYVMAQSVFGESAFLAQN